MNKKINGKVLDELISDNSLEILKTIAKENSEIAKRIREIAMKYLKDKEMVNIEDVADDVYFDLNSIKVEELWDRSGSTRDGYEDPSEIAWEMFEETVEPFLDEMKKFQKLSMYVQAKDFCLGILKGICKFEKESSSEFKNWAADCPAYAIEWVIDEWKKGQKRLRNIVELKKFIKENID